MSVQKTQWPRGVARWGNCSALAVEELATVHFTLCQKPWDCKPSGAPQCASLHAAWWRARADLERANGLPVTPACAAGQQYARLPERISAWPPGGPGCEESSDNWEAQHEAQAQAAVASGADAKGGEKDAVGAKRMARAVEGGTEARVRVCTSSRA